MNFFYAGNGFGPSQLLAYKQAKEEDKDLTVFLRGHSLYTEELEKLGVRIKYDLRPDLLLKDCNGYKSYGPSNLKYQPPPPDLNNIKLELNEQRELNKWYNLYLKRIAITKHLKVQNRESKFFVDELFALMYFEPLSMDLINRALELSGYNMPLSEAKWILKDSKPEEAELIINGTSLSFGKYSINLWKWDPVNWMIGSLKMATMSWKTYTLDPNFYKMLNRLKFREGGLLPQYCVSKYKIGWDVLNSDLGGKRTYIHHCPINTFRLKIFDAINKYKHIKNTTIILPSFDPIQESDKEHLGDPTFKIVLKNHYWYSIFNSNKFPAVSTLYLNVYTNELKESDLEWKKEIFDDNQADIENNIKFAKALRTSHISSYLAKNTWNNYVPIQYALHLFLIRNEIQKMVPRYINFEQGIYDDFIEHIMSLGLEVSASLYQELKSILISTLVINPIKISIVKGVPYTNNGSGSLKGDLDLIMINDPNTKIDYKGKYDLITNDKILIQSSIKPGITIITKDDPIFIITLPFKVYEVKNIEWTQFGTTYIDRTAILKF